MKNLILTLSIVFITSIINAQSVINQAIGTVNSLINGQGSNVSNEEVIKGLREALTIGTKNSTDLASKLDGFNKNTLIKIPFPKDAKKMEQDLRALGMGKKCDEFIVALNRAAERAAKDASPIFINAITSMSLTDGISILKGSDNAATTYLQDKTTADLKIKFLPVVKAALQEVQITKYWNPLFVRYNKIPTVKKVNPDLDDYVTNLSIEGLFKLIAQEENKIRKDPKSRITDLLKKVFG